MNRPILGLALASMAALGASGAKDVLVVSPLAGERMDPRDRPLGWTLAVVDEARVALRLKLARTSGDPLAAYEHLEQDLALPGCVRPVRGAGFRAVQLEDLDGEAYLVAVEDPASGPWQHLRISPAVSVDLVAGQPAIRFDLRQLRLAGDTPGGETGWRTP